jgi:hypothetical protein
VGKHRNVGVGELWKKWEGWTAFEAIFVLGKPSSNTFNVGAPTFLGGAMGTWVV